MLTSITFMQYLYASKINSTSTLFFNKLAGRICPLPREVWKSWKPDWILMSAICRAPQITPRMVSGFSA